MRSQPLDDRIPGFGGVLLIRDGPDERLIGFARRLGVVPA